jgi:signal transduction histidine kinase
MFSYINENFVKFYRTTRESLSKVDSFWDAVYEDPKFRAEIKKRVLDDCASGNTDLMFWEDIPITRKGKKTTYITARNIPIDENRLMVSIVWDTTARKQAEDQIRKMNEELELRVEDRTKQLKDTQEQLIRQERLAVLGQLAGGVSHELRNPLGVISNAAYLLGMMLPNADPKTREYISIIDSETHRAEKIITDLLDFSRVKSAEKESFNLSDLVTKTQNFTKKPDDVKIETKFPDTLPRVSADPSQIALVIGNLLENAYQAMPEGGTVTLTGKEKMIKRKPYVALEVQDTGSGITPENLARLFEPLFTTKQRGIGLGLATSKNLVQSNGGMMDASSEPGKGSLFTVYLPAEKPDLV